MPGIVRKGAPRPHSPPRKLASRESIRCYVLGGWVGTSCVGVPRSWAMDLWTTYFVAIGFTAVGAEHFFIILTAEFHC